MRVFNKDKTKEIFKYDTKKGALYDSKIEIGKTDEIPFIEERGHYETVKEYSNGSKEVKWVVDIEGQDFKPSEPIYEDIQIYVPYTLEEQKEQYRIIREMECFPIINRGEFWFKKLDETQKTELSKWYDEWLDVTETLKEPVKPKWLK